MKKLLIKSLGVGLGILMAASMVACTNGKSSSDGVFDETIEDVRNGEHIYKEAAAMSFDLSYIKDISLTPDKNLCFIGNLDYSSADLDVIICDTSLNELSRVTLKLKDTENLSSLRVDGDGNMYAAVEDNSELYLKKYDSTGKELANIDTQISGDDSAYIDLTDNGIVVGFSDKIKLYDPELNCVSGDSIDPEYFISRVLFKDGNVLYEATSKTDYITKVMGRFDCATSKVTDTGIMAKTNLSYNYLGEAEDYDTVYTLSGNVYGYSYGNEPEKIMNGIASGIKDRLFNVVEIDDSHIAGYSYDYNSNLYTAKVYEKVDAEGDSREILTLGGNYISAEVTSKIIDFNNTSPDYFIVTADYSMYATTDDFDAGAEALKNDILAGKGPDICIFESNDEANLYTGKNAFVDLNEYMKNDGTYDNLLPSVKAICEKDGKIEMVPTECFLTSFAMKKSVYEATGSDASIKNIKAIEDYIKKPAFGEANTKMMILNELTYMASNEFVDYDSRTCSFDSDSFIELLNYINDTYPTELSDDAMFVATDYKNNDAAFLVSSVSGFRQFNSLEKVTFGEEVELSGFTVNGNNNNNSLYCGSIFAISSKSNNKDGAYNIIKEFFTDDYQTSFKYEFPVTLSALDIVAEESTHNPTEIDAVTGEEKEVKETAYTEDGEIEIDPISKERADYLKEVIKNVTLGYNIGANEIHEIIQEEIAPFFAGDKSAEECADIINQRVGIILGEQK